jgi:hypothetical protein
MEYEYSPVNAYRELRTSMRLDTDYDVVVSEQGLLVHGKLFAFPDGDDLVVEVSESRAKDLLERGVADPYLENGEPSSRKVRVSDLQLWPELAREAHNFVGEPAVGGES